MHLNDIEKMYRKLTKKKCFIESVVSIATNLQVTKIELIKNVFLDNLFT